MHVVVSMYLETVAWVLIPERPPQTEAEERRMSRLMSLLLSRFLEFDEEGLELGRPGIRVHRRGRQEIGERAGVAVRRFVAPVQGEADLPELFPVHRHRTQAFGDHGQPLEGAARRRH